MLSDYLDHLENGSKLIDFSSFCFHLVIQFATAVKFAGRKIMGRYKLLNTKVLHENSWYRRAGTTSYLSKWNPSLWIGKVLFRSRYDEQIVRVSTHSQGIRKDCVHFKEQQEQTNENKVRGEPREKWKILNTDTNSFNIKR